MTIEKGKWYWIEFADSCYRRQCIGVTEHGGLFDVPCIGIAERAKYRIPCEADAPPPPPPRKGLLTRLKEFFV